MIKTFLVKSFVSKINMKTRIFRKKNFKKRVMGALPEPVMFDGEFAAPGSWSVDGSNTSVAKDDRFILCGMIYTPVRMTVDEGELHAQHFSAVNAVHKWQ